ncbi:ATP-binding cassette domain-containing protein [Oceanospirillum sanctuarii]|uniref:ATP-binding cassette domain-containing protein n=1 Tax=Oceanospirillum sanctuarii TaxID=1434821 RepID=UPI000A36046C|nr:ATP-binding cassette domain-containing protein [Oceanospirillum sanctuarii]
MTQISIEKPSLMNGAIRVIIAEHGGIWRVLDILEQLQRQMNMEDQAPDAELIHTILDYLQSFSHRIHLDGKDILLHQLLRERVPEAEALLSRQTEDHLIGAVRIAELRGLLDRCAANYPEGRDLFSKQLSRFIFALRKHIKREEGIVVPLAREHLLEADWLALVSSRDQDDDPLFGRQVREEFSALREKISQMTPESIIGHNPAVSKPAPIMGNDTLLKVEGASCQFEESIALEGVSFEVESGDIVAVMGEDGSGKSSLFKAICGLQELSSGSVTFSGLDISRMPADKRVYAGIVHVPEGRQVFGPMSIEDNILLGCYSRKMDASVYSDLEVIYEGFPLLRKQRHQMAGSLSAGEQQLLAMARGLMAKPKLLLIDEPYSDLSPDMVKEVSSVIRRAKKDGITLMLSERKRGFASELANRHFEMRKGILLDVEKAKAQSADADLEMLA